MRTLLGTYVRALELRSWTFGNDPLQAAWRKNKPTPLRGSWLSLSPLAATFVCSG